MNTRFRRARITLKTGAPIIVVLDRDGRGVSEGKPYPYRWRNENDYSNKFYPGGFRTITDACEFLRGFFADATVEPL